MAGRPFTASDVTEIDHHIELVETLQQIDKVLGGIKDHATFPPKTGDKLADYEIDQLVELTKKLSETFEKIAKPLDDAKAVLGAAKDLLKLAEILRSSKTMSGEQQAVALAQWVGAFSGLVGLLPRLGTALAAGGPAGAAAAAAYTIYLAVVTTLLDAVTAAMPQMLNTAGYAAANQLVKDVKEGRIPEVPSGRSREELQAELDAALSRLRDARWRAQLAVKDPCARRIFNVSARTVELEAGKWLDDIEAETGSMNPKVAEEAAHDLEALREKLRAYDECCERALTVSALPSTPSGNKKVLVAGGGLLAVAALAAGIVVFGGDDGGKPTIAEPIPTAPVADDEPAAQVAGDGAPGSTPATAGSRPAGALAPGEYRATATFTGSDTFEIELGVVVGDPADGVTPVVVTQYFDGRVFQQAEGGIRDGLLVATKLDDNVYEVWWSDVSEGSVRSIDNLNGARDQFDEVRRWVELGAGVIDGDGPPYEPGRLREAMRRETGAGPNVGWGTVGFDPPLEG